MLLEEAGKFVLELVRGMRQERLERQAASGRGAFGTNVGLEFLLECLVRQAGSSTPGSNGIGCALLVHIPLGKHVLGHAECPASLPDVDGERDSGAYGKCSDKDRHGMGAAEGI